MKEKLLELVQACINDESMYKPEYVDGQYRGISERITHPRTSYTECVKYKGSEITVNNSISKYICDLTPYHKQEMTGYEINIGFGKEPLLNIRPVIKGNKASLPKEIVKVEGFINSWLIKYRTFFDVTVITEVYHYELRCGRFVYIIDESVVKGFAEQIAEKRIQLAYQADLKEINSRLTKYNIDNVK